MVLYALCVHPFLRMLELHVARFINVRRLQISPIVAYADYITVLLTQPANFEIVRRALHTYERASGALLNPHKSKA
jgi:hypothetical protein